MVLVSGSTAVLIIVLELKASYDAQVEMKKKSLADLAKLFHQQ